MKPLGTMLSPCKINLHLDVLGRRPDAFHDLLSIFVQCDLYDQLGFYEIQGTGQLEIQDKSGIPAEQNIIYKAYELLKERLPGLPSLFVSLKKEIPLEAGLGGGSSNAAAMVTFVNAIMGHPLDEAALMGLGARLGSDVPFFLGEPQAVVGGRGELLYPLVPRTDYQVLLINPGFGISTAQAFRDHDQALKGDESAGKFSEEQLSDFYSRENPGDWPFFNSFLPVVSQGRPFFQKIFSELSEQKCLFSGLSGSGASVFAVFQDQIQAEKAFFCFKKQYFFVKLIFPLAKRVKPVLQ